MSIENLDWIWPLALLLLMGLALVLWTLRRDQRDLKILGHQNLILSPQVAWGRRVLKGFLLLLAFFFIWGGAVRLQGKPTAEDLTLRGSDVVILLDLSKSMLTQDIVPNRLGAAQKAINDWVQNEAGDRVGLAVFAGEALIQVPLTFDLQAVSMVLNNDDTDTVSRGGTDIGEGIRTALSAFPADNPNKRGRAIVLMTDGELTDGASNLAEACEEAKNKGVPIVTVGMGTPEGKPIPTGVSFWGEPTYAQNNSGEVHISRLDEQTLKQVADSTGGVYISGDNPSNLKSIQSALNGLQTTQMKGQGAIHRQEYAPALGWMAAGTLVLSTFL